MHSSFYLAIGFISGILVCLIVGIVEMVGKLNKTKIKQIIEILFGE